MADTVEIAVVGGSVRGTVLVERLLANAPDLLAGAALRITVIDAHPPGSGRIWRDGQSPHLIMNTVAAQSTVFTDDSVRVDGPVTPGPNLAQWCELVTADASLADLPPDVAAEAARTRDDSSPSRLLYGYYLRWCFARIAEGAPSGTEVRVVADRVVDLAPRTNVAGDAGWTLTLASGRAIDADAVLLALGWLPHAEVAAHPRVVAAGNPIDQDLSSVAPGATVAVRGLGMGFFDTVSLLTEGRGGAFTPGGYRPSGAEPLIVAGSRRGIPYRAKPVFGAPPFFPAQRILRAALPGLRSRRPVDFGADVLPLIHRDALFDYYRALARVRPEAVHDLDHLLAGLRDATVELDALTAVHVPHPGDRLDLAAAADPLAATVVDGDIDGVVADLVRRDAAEAALGHDSPLKLGLHSYAAARGAVVDLVAFGGITAASFPAYRRFLEIAASFGSGPPLLRARQLLALHEAGLVRFAGPGMTVRVHDDGVEVAGASGAAVRADALVEAWLPTPTVERTGDPLLRALLDRGLARAWQHPGGGASDAVEVRPGDGALIGADGEPVAGVHSVGVPHEDIRVFTIIAPVPGTDSPVLRESDAAARAALVSARARFSERTPA